MKTVIPLILAFLLASAWHTQAGLVEQDIYAATTLLASTCTVIQTGPMQLTIPPCSWTTTGLSRIVSREKVPNLTNEIAAGRVEMTPNGRVRGWLRDKTGNILEKSRTRILPSSVTFNITAGMWAIYLVDGPGVTMVPTLVAWSNSSKDPAGTLDYLVLPFPVPVGTTDLSGITIEFHVIKPGVRPAKGVFEK